MLQSIRHIGRIALSILLSILLLIGVITWLVTWPGIQTWMVNHSQGILSRQIGTRVELAEVDVALPYYAELNGLVVYDLQEQPLICIETLRIDVFSFNLWAFLLKLSAASELSTDELQLIRPDIFLYKPTNDTSLNLKFLTDQLKNEDTTKAERPIRIVLPNISLRDGTLTFIDSTQTDMDSVGPGRINFHHIHLEELLLKGSLVKEPEDRWDICVDSLTFVETWSGFRLDNLRAVLVSDIDYDQSYPSPFVDILDVSLHTDSTRLYGDFHFPNEELGDVFEFEPDEYYEATVASSFIHTQTLNYLVKEPLPMRGLIGVTGRLSGTIDDLAGRNVHLAYRNGIRLYGNLGLSNLREPDRARMDVRVENSRISMRDFHQLFPDIKVPDFLKQLDLQGIEGEFKGGFFDFLAEVKTESDLGMLEANLEMKLPPKVPVVLYSGTIAAKNLNVNELGFSEDQVSRDLSLTGNIDGQGFSLEELDAQLDLQIGRSDLFTYAVDSMDADVRVSDRKISGKIYAKDTEGALNLTVDLDVSKSPAVYILDGKVKRFNLKTYGLYKEPILLSGLIDVDLNGDSLDNINGELKVVQALLENETDTSQVRIPDLWFSALDNQANQKYYNLKSSLVDVDVGGNFTINKAIELTKRLAFESQLYLTNNDSLIQDYYANKVLDSVTVDAQLGIGIKEKMNPLLAFLDVPLYLSPGALLVGNLQFGSSEQTQFTFSVDSATYKQVALEGTQLDLHVIKNSNSNSLAVVGGLKSDSMRIGPKLGMENVSFDVQGLENRFESDLIATQGPYSHKVQLKVITRFFPDGRIESVLDDKTSFLEIPNDTLEVREGNSVTIIDRNTLDIRNLMIAKDNRYFRLDGLISRDPDTRLNLLIGQLDLGLVEYIYPVKYVPGGQFNLDIDIFDLLNSPRVRGISRIDQFQLNAFQYGDAFIKGEWNEADGDLKLEANFTLDGDTTLAMQGYYGFKDPVAPLHFDLFTCDACKGFPLNYINPFVESQLFGVKGNVQLDTFTIRGHPDKLDVKGTGNFRKAGFGVKYFNTYYDFDGRIRFDKDRISFPRLQLYDKNRKHADFHGVIRHRGLREFTFDLQLDQMNNFLVMDTKKGDNELFYGTLYVKDGIADISGDLDKLKVQAILSSGNNSALKIPVSDFSAIERPDYIRFVGEEDPTEATINTGLKGFELELTAITTDNVEIDMIFDERVGDIIRGKGNGVITLKIDEGGDFSMFGDFEVTEGDYLFTAQNVFNKKFEIKPGGRVTWTGDPFDADINIDAFYPLYADVSKLLSNDADPVRAPVNVLMHLEGILLEPEIQLSIELPSLSQQNVGDIANQLANIQHDEQELNKQVFSLMVFNRFAPVGGFLEGSNLAGLGVTTSISELLSNQLNYWLSQATNDKFNVNVGTSNFQDVNLLVSAKLFNDRVTIERDGTLVGPNSNFSIGNISLIIKLLPRPGDVPTSVRPSEMVLEVFNRENIDIKLNNSSYQTGIGVFYKKDFNSLRELFRKNK